MLGESVAFPPRILQEIPRLLFYRRGLVFSYEYSSVFADHTLRGKFFRHRLGEASFLKLSLFFPLGAISPSSINNWSAESPGSSYLFGV